MVLSGNPLPLLLFRGGEVFRLVTGFFGGFEAHLPVLELEHFHQPRVVVVPLTEKQVALLLAKIDDVRLLPENGSVEDSLDQIRIVVTLKGHNCKFLRNEPSSPE